ncbi:hypothetical protein MANES_16G057250v8 [Manihot esculenta]|uniref:Uncharacterized protein n=1 Tax=Manihot esculenta TaxID=3983 RepID=A0ACB7G6M1_MANES|nr:hypothetical protein MANES_16G057250v8 [Manihot esculenta]
MIDLSMFSNANFNCSATLLSRKLLVLPVLINSINCLSLCLPMNLIVSASCLPSTAWIDSNNFSETPPILGDQDIAYKSSSIGLSSCTFCSSNCIANSVLGVHW